MKIKLHYETTYVSKNKQVLMKKAQDLKLQQIATAKAEAEAAKAAEKAAAAAAASSGSSSSPAASGSATPPAKKKGGFGGLFRSAAPK
jgi:septal ring factor EnvC (AmiA/AmiB activator)